VGVACGADADTTEGLLLHDDIDKSLVNLSLSRDVCNGGLDVGELLLSVVGTAAQSPRDGARFGHDGLVDLPQCVEGKPLVLAGPSIAVRTIAFEGRDVRSSLASAAAVTATATATAQGSGGGGTIVG
jgi:hypothetical protein